MAAASNVGENFSEIKKILEKLEDGLNSACSQLAEETPSQENESFNKDVFWNDFINATKLVSHESTKFCMMFNKQPLPSYEECKLLIEKIESRCLALVAVFFSLPKSRGKTLHKEIRLYVLFILSAVKQLCTAAKNQSTSQLQNVGTVWEKCQAVESLPKNNKDAVIALCEQEHSVIEDASQELMDAIQNDPEDNDDNEDIEINFLTQRNGFRLPSLRFWTDADRHVTLPSSGLVKAMKACIKKTLNAIALRGADDDSSIVELDAIADIIKYSGELVDDFVFSLYPPMNHSVVRHQASLVRNNSKDLLAAVEHSHFCSEEDTMWIAFLERAVDHNWVKINDIVLAD